MRIKWFYSKELIIKYIKKIDFAVGFKKRNLITRNIFSFWIWGFLEIKKN